MLMAYAFISFTLFSRFAANLWSYISSYPVVYSILILPLTIVRFIGFGQEAKYGAARISSGATLTVAAVYGLSGACNVVLIRLTRSKSTLFGPRKEYDDDQ